MELRERVRPRPQNPRRLLKRAARGDAIRLQTRLWRHLASSGHRPKHKASFCPHLPPPPPPFSFSFSSGFSSPPHPTPNLSFPTQGGGLSEAYSQSPEATQATDRKLDPGRLPSEIPPSLSRFRVSRPHSGVRGVRLCVTGQGEARKASRREG